MRSFGISIKGRTKNFTLPKSQPLIPLFEAIVNSFHSIEERKKADRSFTDGRILIEFERDGQMMFDVDGSISEINNMIVTDNGSGFDENNFSSFLESDSTYKEAIGGKGVGRFSWLHAFEKAEIESVYLDGDTPVKRSFVFSLASNEINDRLVDVDNYCDNKTSVKLAGFLAPYRTTALILYEEFLLRKQYGTFYSHNARDIPGEYFPMPKSIFRLGLTAGEILVYTYLMYCEDRKTFQCHPSYATIGEAVNMSNNTVAKHVDGLVRKVLITTERTTVKTRDGRTHNGSLLYTLCPLAPVEQAYFEKQIREASARMNFKAALEKYNKKKGGA